MTDTPDAPTIMSPWHLFLRPHFTWRDIPIILAFALLVLGAVIGGSVVYHKEREICGIRLTTVEKSRDSLLRMIAEADAKGKGKR